MYGVQPARVIGTALTESSSIFMFSLFAYMSLTDIFYNLPKPNPENKN